MPVKSQSNSADNEPQPGPENGKKLSKRQIKMEDGRYMIFYTGAVEDESVILPTEKHV